MEWLSRFTLALAFIACLSTAGCSYNVRYAEDVREAGERLTCPGAGQQIALFLDREGDLYPPSDISVGDMVTPHARPIGDSGVATIFRGLSRPEAAGQLNALFSLTGTPPGGPLDARWQHSQQRLKSRASDRIMALLSDNPDARLVVLIHGYNNDYFEAKQWYDLVSCDMHARDPSTIFVRIHWDGLKENLPISIWGKAQRNGPLAGVGLRPIFSRIAEHGLGREAVVITHSTGALVAAALLGDSSAPFAKSDDMRFLERIRSSQDLPDARKFRLGLLIPAAAYNTFDSYDIGSVGGRAGKEARVPARLVLGLNDDDAPTNKYLLTCKISGDTCMNTWAKKACSSIRKKFEDVDNFAFGIYEFSNSVRNEGETFIFWEQHGVAAQLMRDRWSGFIDGLLGDQVTAQDDSASACD